MQAAVLLSVAFLAVALGEEAVTSASLRGSRSLADAVDNRTLEQTAAVSTAEELEASVAPAGADTSGLEVAAVAAPAAWLEADNHSLDALGLLLGSSGGWYQGGDKVWGSGAGIENVNPDNVGYYDQGMAVAHACCGDAGCALIVNPPGHRTVGQFHIHLAHYQGYGSSLKTRLESLVCGSSGWHGGGLPCGGSAAFFPGFPAVFSAAMRGGNIHGASVIAWPASCGGRGTIVELAYGCSIEHQIRGDFNPSLR